MNPIATSPRQSIGYPIRIRTLNSSDRFRVLKHFMALDYDDRILRFGMVLHDDGIQRYVDSIDYQRHTIFGVYDPKLKLVAVGHLAPASLIAVSDSNLAKQPGRIAEFGLSVLPSARGLGVGTQLFERARIHCSNTGITTLIMQCLSTNKTMMRIARKAGMEIQQASGEAEAYLVVPRGNPVTFFTEAVQEHLAGIDFLFKANAKATARWLTHRIPTPP